MWSRIDNQEVGLEAAILERKRNSSLVKRFCAEDVTGLKYTTEAMDVVYYVVEEYCSNLRRCGVTHAGGTTRAHGSMSSDKTSEKLVRRKPKVSWERVILPGLVGPKARPKGVVDGQQVNIPVPPAKRYQP